jgi:hypothetical protein
MEYLEVSSKLNSNVHEAFVLLVELLMNEQEKKKYFLAVLNDLVVASQESY